MNLAFVCNGDSQNGFGHVARCLQLAGLLRRSLKPREIVFQGTYSPAVAERIRATLPNVAIRPEEDRIDSALVVVDRLGKPDELDSHPLELLDRLAGRVRRLVYLASGTSAPPTRPGQICIGYQPGGPTPAPPSLLWGFDYAPVAADLLRFGKRSRRMNHALIALGGASDARGLQLALEALDDLSEIETVDILASPTMSLALPGGKSRQDYRIYRSIPSVGPLLAKAGLVVASFGNLFYEALALGAPVCLLAQKPFQQELATRAVGLGLAVDAGAVAVVSGSALAARLRETIASAETLSRRGPRAVDGRGLDRIAAAIVNSLDREAA